MKKILWTGSKIEVVLNRVIPDLSALYTDAEVITRPDGLKPHVMDKILDYACEQGCTTLALRYDEGITEEFIKSCNDRDIEIIMEEVTKSSTNRHTYHKESKHWFVMLDIAHNGWNKVVGATTRETEKNIFVDLMLEPIIK